MSDTDEAASAQRSMAGSKRLALVVLVCAIFAAALTWGRYADDNLLVYRTAAAKLVSGQDMYELEEDIAAFSYPPLMGLPMTPLVGMPLWAQVFLWQWANVLMLTASVVLIRRCIDPMLPERYQGTWRLPWYAYVVFALLAGRHLLSPLENRSHDVLILLTLMLSAYAMLGARGAIAGAWAGIAAALKATPLLFLPVFAWQRRFWAVVTMLIAMTAGTLLPDLIFPRADGELWTVAWYEQYVSRQRPGAPAEGEGAWVAWNHLNQNLAGAIYRISRVPHNPIRPDVSIWHPSDRVLRGITLAAQLAVLAFVFVTTRPGLTRKLRTQEAAIQRVGQFSLVLCAMLLLSPMSSKAHFCVLGLPIAFCLADFFSRRRSAVTAVLLGLVFVLGTLTVKDVIGRPWGNWLLAIGSVMWCTIALMLATAWVLRDRRGAALGQTQSEHATRVAAPS